MRPFVRQLRRAVHATSALSMIAFVPAAAHAQEAGASADVGNDEIIVTARDLERLEALLAMPPNRGRSDLDGLRDELARATVVDTDSAPAHIIALDRRARFREETSGREYELTIAWPHEANAADGKVSIFSPAGSALLGLSVGQSIDWQTPEGHAIQLRILAVSHGA